MLSERALSRVEDPAEQAEGWGLLRVRTGAFEDGTPVLRLEGDLDIYNTRDFSNRLMQTESTATDLVVDLSSLKFIDCAGLHQLVEAGQRARSRGGRLRLIKGPQPVHRVFTLTGLDSAFEFLGNRP